MSDATLLLQQMPKWRRTFPLDFAFKNERDRENENGEREEPLPPHWQLIEGQQAIVPNFSINLLRTHYSTSEGKQIVCIEWNSLVNKLGLGPRLFWPFFRGIPRPRFLNSLFPDTSPRLGVGEIFRLDLMLFLFLFPNI